MTTESILKTCQLLYSSHNLPIICFDNEENIIGYNCSCQEYKPVFHTLFKKATKEKNPSLVTGYAGLYGVIFVKNYDCTILTGPFVNKKVTNELLDSIIHTNNLDWSKKESLKEFIAGIPHFSYNRFLSFISLPFQQGRNLHHPAFQLCDQRFRNRKKIHRKDSTRRKYLLAWNIQS